MARILNFMQRRGAWGLVALLFLSAVPMASAETLLMPRRDFLMGASEVVWGATTLDNHNTGGIPTTYEFDFNNDGTFDVSGSVTDRSYIAVNRIFPLAGTFTIRLKVTRGATVEEATTDVNVYDAAALNATDLRNLNVNRAIASGIRYLWTSQNSRTTNFPASLTTSWSSSFPTAYTSLIVLALQNHGYLLPNNDTMPTGIIQKYLVRRGMNFVLNNALRQNSMAAQNSPSTGVASSNNPCVGPGIEAAPCVGLYIEESGHAVYETGLAILPLASSGALSRTVFEVPGTNSAGYVVGKTYREVLQRMVNTVAWGQGDLVSNGQGGWCYVMNQNCGDGSSEGWILLALLDAEAAGATIPAFVRTEWGYNSGSILTSGALVRGLNNDGSFDYQTDNSRASNNSVNVAKTGVGLQGAYFAGRPLADADVQNALSWINARWHTPSGEGFLCSGSVTNKGCGYGMFNVFKALKLYGVTTLPNVNRPAGSVGDPDDWHADYTDWLVANQTSPLTTGGGNWGPLHFSSQVTGNEPAEAAQALLILAPTALVLPDPTTFSEVGLRHGNPPLALPAGIQPASNPVGTSHTVTAVVTAATGAPVSTVTVNFQVISGPNMGKSGSGVTNAQGQTTFTYTDTAGPGTDQIRASIGQLTSNTLEKIWLVAVGARCDVDNNQVVNTADLTAIRAAIGQVANATDPRDGNGDGAINIADVRYCQLRLGPVAAN